MLDCGVICEVALQGYKSMKVAGIACLILGMSLLMLTLIGSVSLDAGSKFLGTSGVQLVIRAVVGVILLIVGAFMRKRGEVK